MILLLLTLVLVLMLVLLVLLWLVLVLMLVLVVWWLMLRKHWLLRWLLRQERAGHELVLNKGGTQLRCVLELRRPHRNIMLKWLQIW